MPCFRHFPSPFQPSPNAKTLHPAPGLRKMLLQEAAEVGAGSNPGVPNSVTGLGDSFLPEEGFAARGSLQIMSPCHQSCPLNGQDCPGAVLQALLPQCEVCSQTSPGHCSSQGSCPKTTEVQVFCLRAGRSCGRMEKGVPRAAQPLRCTAHPSAPSMLISSLPKAFEKQLPPPQSVRHGERDCRIHVDRKFCKVMSFNPLQTSWEVGGETMLVSWLGQTRQERSAFLESKVWVKVSKLMNERIHILIHEVVRQLQPSRNSYGRH